MATAQRDEGAHANTTTTQYQEEASDELDRSIEDSQDEIVMAINANNSGSFGCSYFAANDQSLWLMSDVKYGNVELVDCRECSPSKQPSNPASSTNVARSQGTDSAYHGVDALSSARVC